MNAALQYQNGSVKIRGICVSPEDGSESRPYLRLAKRFVKRRVRSGGEGRREKCREEFQRDSTLKLKVETIGFYLE